MRERDGTQQAAVVELALERHADRYLWEEIEALVLHWDHPVSYTHLTLPTSDLV